MRCPGQIMDEHADQCVSEPTVLPLIANPLNFNPMVDWQPDDKVDEGTNDPDCTVIIEPEIEPNIIYFDLLTLLV